VSAAGDDEAILFTNAAFYLAFQNGDLEAMDNVWAKDAPVACLHPGAVPIFDRSTIMQSWRDILSDEGVSGIRFHFPRIISRAETALVVGFETFGINSLAATNGFVKEGGQWRMNFHQAGPCPDAPAPEGEDAEHGNGPLH